MLILHFKISSVSLTQSIYFHSFLFSIFCCHTGQSSVHPDWNFYKYLVDQNGAVLRAWSTKSTIEEIFDNIEQAIDANSADIASEPVNTDPEAAEAVKDEL